MGIYDIQYFDVIREVAWEKGRKEGREEGREEGIEKMAIGFLKAGVERTLIKKVTGLSDEKLDKLEREILTNEVS